jgi:hypothetical protein
MRGRSVSSRVGEHLRSNIVGYIAIFLFAIGGTAYAVDGPLAGQNTVGSADIINTEVHSADIGDGEIRGVDIHDATIQGNDVDANTLTGDNIVESSLGEVPSATSATSAKSATIGGYGRWSGGWDCDPESEEYTACAVVDLNLDSPARVVLNAQVTATTEPDSTKGFGKCQINTTAGTLTSTNSRFSVAHMENPDFATVVIGRDLGALTGMTHVLVPGEYGFWLECNQDQSAGAIRYQDSGITAVAISPR